MRLSLSSINLTRFDAVRARVREWEWDGRGGPIPGALSNSIRPGVVANCLPLLPFFGAASDRRKGNWR